MSSHSARIRALWDAEAKALLLEAERAKVLDHHGSRGSEVEHSVLLWLNRRFGPAYSITSGEVIDSFDTAPELASRQQDGIVYRHDHHANRFVLPSGLRLVPVESIAAIVEVKLTLDKGEFDKSDATATQTSRLRLRLASDGQIPHDRIEEQTYGSSYCGTLSTASMVAPSGLALDSPDLRPNRPPFTVFGFRGPAEVDTLVGWLKGATTAELVCCLTAGCAFRRVDGSVVSVAANSALPTFAEQVEHAVDRHQCLQRLLCPDFSGYFPNP